MMDNQCLGTLYAVKLAGIAIFNEDLVDAFDLRNVLGIILNCGTEESRSVNVYKLKEYIQPSVQMK
jgi:hypothetical protein